MTRILVTGGTGVLGRAVVERLTGADTEVLILSRRADPARPAGVRAVRGDLATGDGLADAVRDVDTIVHCASNAGMGDAHADVASTRRLLDAARAGRAPHIVYISIVGVHRVPYGYYQAKLAAERLIEDSGLPWTILRASQFHDLVYLMVALLCRSPVVPAPTGLRADPVDTREVADRLADLARGAPAGRVPDLAGPRVLTVREAIGVYLGATGRRRLVVPIALPGRTVAAFRAGGNLLESGERGERTFEQYVRERVTADGGTRLPYALRRR